MDKLSGLCIGCLRTLDEIARWASTDDQHRARILAAVAQRRAAASPTDQPDAPR